MWPSAYLHSVGTLEGSKISRLNTRPARAPVNASPPPSRTSAHDSEPVWLARPSPSGSFIRNTSPVLRGARKFLQASSSRAQITVDLPDDIAGQSDPGREALAIEGQCPGRS